MIAVSACLLGICCRYDGGCAVNHELKELYAANGMVAFVCKERTDGKLVLPEAVKIMKIKA